jgi:hypothetical protein
MSSRLTLAAAVALAVVFLLPGCSGGGSASSSSGTAMLNVRLTDSPIDPGTVQNVWVTLTGVIVYPDETMDAMDPMHVEGPPPIHLMTHPQTFDLMTLTGGATALLASGEVPVGTYARIRLEISDASLVYKDASTAPVTLKCESNKVDVPIRFHVSAGPDNTIVLDFDAAASVKVNETGSGVSILRPVVTPVP